MSESSDKDRQREPWHRIFGLFFYEVFTPRGWRVDIESDLSLKQQLLDVLVVRGKGAKPPDPLPDGLEDLREHNLFTFKSLHEALDEWALKELTGHYVNYRKQITPQGAEMSAEGSFGLYGVCCREPRKLMGELPLTEILQGVYETTRGSDTFRIIVARQVAPVKRNYLWHLFSAEQERVSEAAQAFQAIGISASSLVNRLYQHYQLEGLTMPYTMEDFKREVAREFLTVLPPEERLKGLPPEERLKGLPPEERLKGLPPEERLKGLPPEELLKGLLGEERVRDLTLVEIEELLKAIQQRNTPPQSETPGDKA